MLVWSGRRVGLGSSPCEPGSRNPIYLLDNPLLCESLSIPLSYAHGSPKHFCPPGEPSTTFNRAAPQKICNKLNTLPGSLASFGATT